ncbi:MAG: hypothetical protein KF847_06740 [Pirellulales bacterium]|nr:hypothetical protein [Pirellulales bacterium]
MSSAVIHINRYPNRRFYCRSTSEYVSLERIEQFVRDGATVEIRDSHTQQDITRIVLAQLLIERQPEKIALFPTPMLHLLLRANDLMTDFLRSYFRDSLTYLEYLQKHGATARLSQPIHWLQSWLEGAARRAGVGPAPAGDDEPPPPDSPAELAERIAELESRLRRLEHGEQAEDGGDHGTKGP